MWFFVEPLGIGENRGFQRETVSPSSVVTIRQRSVSLKLRPSPPNIGFVPTPVTPVPYDTMGFIIARNYVMHMYTYSVRFTQPS